MGKRRTRTPFWWFSWIPCRIVMEITTLNQSYMTRFSFFVFLPILLSWPSLKTWETLERALAAWTVTLDMLWPGSNDWQVFAACHRRFPSDLTFTSAGRNEGIRPLAVWRGIPTVHNLGWGREIRCISQSKIKVRQKLQALLMFLVQKLWLIHTTD